MKISINVKSIILGVFLLMILCSNTIIGSRTETTILLACLVSVFYCRFKIKDLDNRGRFTVFFYCGFLLFLIANMLLSYSRDISFEYVILFIASFLLFFVTWKRNNINAFFSFGRAVCVFLAFTILLAVIFPSAVIEISKFTNPGRSGVIASEIADGKFSGLVGEKALAAYAMVFGANIEIASYFIQNKRLTKKNYILILLYFVCTLLTSKRMLTLILFIEIVIALRFFQVRNKGAKILIGVFIGLVLMLVAFLLVPQTRNIVERFIEGEEDATFNGRTKFWEFCIEMFLQKPILGYGIGTFNSVFAEQVGYLYQGKLWDMHAHNIYFQILGEGGIVGFLLFVSFLIYCFFKSIKLFKSNHLSNFWKSVLWFSISSQVLFILYGITGNCLYDVSQIFAYLLSISFYLTVNRVNKRAIKEMQIENEKA